MQETDRLQEGSRAGFKEPRLPYWPGIDGLRALAVIAVLVYHMESTWLPGGFLGVEVFFVISGFLITSLLLAEWDRTGRINFGAFWLRRARRLLPAVYLLLVAVLAYAVIFLPDEVSRLRWDAAVSAGYVTNWYLILSHQSYFEAVGRPSLLRHLWSLAIEEQFYVVWPLLLAALLRWLHPRRRVVLLLLVATAASTLLMALLYSPELDPSRVYYGTDTRAAGLLIGAILAFLWAPAQGRSGSQANRRPRGILLDVAGILALACVALACWRLGEFNPLLYRSGFALVSIATAALIAMTIHPGAGILPRALGWAPLRWAGQRSYGIYLWHWPVFMVTRPELDVSIGWIAAGDPAPGAHRRPGRALLSLCRDTGAPWGFRPGLAPMA